MRVGIDASNLRQGGGVTHLVQLLAAAVPREAGIERVTVWGGRQILEVLPNRPWLERLHEPSLDRRGLSRTRWQQRTLASLARKSVDVLFSPGGTYLGKFRPFVTMFRNMLPFDASERRRYGLSRMRLKLEILWRVQRATFARADGVIFLTKHARAHLLGQGLRIPGRQAVIPHGLDPLFFGAQKPQPSWQEFSSQRPFRWLYVSAIHAYKHPWNVAEAVAQMRSAGMPVTLTIVGPPYPAALVRLESTLKRVDPAGAFIRFVPGVSHAELPRVYSEADGFVFASSCENMPNSLLEAMAAGLPIVSSERPPMPDILQDGGLYGDPESPASLADAMNRLMIDERSRTRVAAVAQDLARGYNWERCALDTFQFLAMTGSAGAATRTTRMDEH
ncbi:MAG: glycosyltransferase family 1 protein [Acidobacteriota bacterium]